MLFNLIPVYWNWVIQMQRFFYLLLKPQVLRTNCKCLQNILSVISTAKHYIIFGADVFFLISTCITFQQNMLAYISN